MDGNHTLKLRDLDQFELRQSADEVKTDLELLHLACGRVLCDAEHKDSLAVLAGVAIAHNCNDEEN